MRTKLPLALLLLLALAGPALAFGREGDVIAVSKDGFTLVDDENEVFVFRLDKNLAAGGAKKDPPGGKPNRHFKHRFTDVMVGDFVAVNYTEDDNGNPIARGVRVYRLLPQNQK
jgi:hypothetical protein